MIHQNFTVTGIGLVIEIYDDRAKATNAGSSLIGVDRMLVRIMARDPKLVLEEAGLSKAHGGKQPAMQTEAACVPARWAAPSSVRRASAIHAGGRVGGEAVRGCSGEASLAPVLPDRRA